jgi:hypothetical protein
VGLRDWLKDPLGLKAQAAAQQRMVLEVLRVTQEQSQAAMKMVEVMDRLYAATTTDGTPPEGRHFTDEWEADLFNEMEANRGQ